MTTDFVYLRFIGDRSIPEEEFGRIQKNRDRELHYWAKVIKEAQADKKLKAGFVAANNHYQGFGPATTNSFRKLLGQKEAVWDELKQGRLDL